MSNDKINLSNKINLSEYANFVNIRKYMRNTSFDISISKM